MMIMKGWVVGAILCFVLFNAILCHTEQDPSRAMTWKSEKVAEKHTFDSATTSSNLLNLYICTNNLYLFRIGGNMSWYLLRVIDNSIDTGRVILWLVIYFNLYRSEPKNNLEGFCI
jgi:hypothetical protein